VHRFQIVPHGDETSLGCNEKDANGLPTTDITRLVIPSLYRSIHVNNIPTNLTSLRSDWQDFGAELSARESRRRIIRASGQAEKNLREALEGGAGALPSATWQEMLSMRQGPVNSRPEWGTGGWKKRYGSFSLEHKSRTRMPINPPPRKQK